MIPSRFFLFLTALLGAAGIAASIWPALQTPWWIVLGALVAAALADAAAVATHRGLLKGERQIAAAIPVGVWTEVTLRFTRQAHGAIRFSVYDRHPTHCDIERLPQTLTLDSGAFAISRYRLRANTRGDLIFGRTELRITSPLRLWERSELTGSVQTVRSLPNFAAISRYALFATENRLSQLGVLRKRRRGEGQSFHQLREYRQGDTLRQIDWKASARMRRLVSREYEDERDQRIVFLIDCGRRMAARQNNDELSHFDHALNAVLLLAYVALREGDATGLMTFAGEEERYISPSKSRGVVNRFLEILYDLQPTLQTPDYTRAVTALGARLNRRSLVIIVSNARDEDNDDLRHALAMLGQRHLVVFANLREREIDDALLKPIHTLDDATTYAAACAYRDARDLLHTNLVARGTQLVDVEPHELPTALVNRYLDLKHGGAV